MVALCSCCGVRCGSVLRPARLAANRAWSAASASTAPLGAIAAATPTLIVSENGACSAIPCRSRSANSYALSTPAPGKHDEELLAAGARGDVGATGLLGEPVRDPSQRAVAGVVTVRVVDALKWSMSIATTASDVPARTARAIS